MLFGQLTASLRPQGFDRHDEVQAAAGFELAREAVKAAVLVNREVAALRFGCHRRMAARLLADL